MWESEKKFKKGDNIILTAFGADLHGVLFI
jgi:3-oxoacyl-[acyl-carrier-protein] synthase III